MPTTPQQERAGTGGHTAGPWHRHDRVGGDFDGLTVQSDYGLIARLPDPDDAENQANARLIAAAPDLLATIQELMESQIEYESCAGAYEQTPCVPKVREYYRASKLRSRKAWNAARAAIARATSP